MLFCTLISLLFLSSVDGQLGMSTQTHTRVNVVRKCTQNQNLPADASHISLLRLRTKDLINMTLTIRENIAEPNDRMQLVVNTEKCRSKESSDTCMQFLELKTTKFCDVLFSKLYGAASFIQCLQPEMKSCPIKKGIYTATNCSPDYSLFDVMPLWGSYWKVTIKIYKNTRLVACTYGEGYVFKI